MRRAVKGTEQTEQYLSPEPLLQEAEYVTARAYDGVPTPSYAYGWNNPVTFVDPDGLQGTCAGGRCTPLPGGGALGGAGDAAAAAAAEAAAAAAAAAASAARCAEEKARKDRCTDHYVKCVDEGTAVSVRPGQTLCGQCLDYCTAHGFWPLAVYTRLGPKSRTPCPGQ